ncbi:hypothetical protein [Bradyrhizobium iriomotense]|uniref:hypothetical protein n=1 Tax=Bradyrhizobium iriomotense TaxID=441950 RepID=UPI001B89F181|nr:hypothetical protein [Bradyrhizobium iriomotense]MBR0785295.1 hypothetical protein [Bradyrhizobium iriomotense]
MCASRSSISLRRSKSCAESPSAARPGALFTSPAAAFGEHSCTKGNGNAVNIYVWKKGRQASILFAPVKPHPESGSVERLKAVAGRVYGKL